jgi:hypothetical protein
MRRERGMHSGERELPTGVSPLLFFAASAPFVQGDRKVKGKNEGKWQ